MIRGLVDFALNNRFLVVVIAVLLLGWGIISFQALPIEAYPDVANNYVQVITQWPGRAAEEVEQQVPSTGPTEGIRLANQARVLLASFPEVTVATSQVGRPDDGTDTTGFFNTEFFVDLKENSGGPFSTRTKRN